MKHTDHLTHNAAHRIHSAIRVVPDFPRPGILFRDVTPALADSATFHLIVEAMCAPHLGRRPDVVVGIESRGFIFGAAIAQCLDVGFVPVRKAGKLPGAVDRIDYSLEYGTASLEMSLGALRKGARVIVVDDLLATGGTACAAAFLARRQGAEVISFDFMVELEALGGERAIVDADPFNALADVHRVLTY